MYRDDVSGCWWYTLSNIDMEQEYSFQYHLWKREETLRLADAYSEKILDPWNDKYIPASTYPGLTYPKETNGIVSVFQAHKPEYTWQQMCQIRSGLEQGIDVSIYSNPKFDFKQMRTIRFGLEKNLDVSIYAKPEYTSAQMRKIRESLQQQKDNEEELSYE